MFGSNIKIKEELHTFFFDILRPC